MVTFQYHPEIGVRYPQIVGGVILARNLSNDPAPEALKAEYTEEQQAALNQKGDIPSINLSE